MTLRDSRTLAPPAPAHARPALTPTDLLALLEEALALRQEAVRTAERLLAGPPCLNALAAARARVQALAAASAVLLEQLERAAGAVEPRGGASRRRDA